MGDMPGSFDYCGRVSSTVRPEPVEGPPRACRPFALSPSKGRPEWISKLTTNGLEELPPTIERPWWSAPR